MASEYYKAMQNCVIYFIVLCCLAMPIHGAFAGYEALFDAIEKKRWSVAQQKAKGDTILEDVVQWAYLKDPESAVSFDQVAHFIDKHPNWPELNKLRLNAEKELFQMRNDAAGEWLKKYPPISGYGKFALARQDKKQAPHLAAAGWRDGDFDRDDEMLILKEFSPLLDQSHHRARIARLLEEDKASVAERIISKVDDDHRLLYAARIALIRRDGNVDRKIDHVPARLKGDHCLLVDRVKWRHDKGLKSGALKLLKEMHPDNPCAEKVWRIRSIYARDFIEIGNHSGALAILQNAGNTLEGENKADALWLVGWTQFEFLNNPGAAYKAFFELFNEVKYPISKARGAYWAGQAADRNGNKEIAKGWFEVAARYPSTFYGQLAYHRINKGKPLKLPVYEVDKKLVSVYQRSPLIKVAKRLMDEGQANLSDPFIVEMATDADTPAKLIALSEAVGQLGMRYAGVRVAKFAARKNLVLLRYGWPWVQIGEESSLDPALPLAISRQESEFNHEAMSFAGARGLMQLMPSTASRMAKKMGMSYSKRRLFDASYNATIGSAYLQDLVERFEGSYSLAIAGYNAGPGRPSQWVRRFGRPGYDIDQAVRWIEMIPFGETRNYVMRVLENVQVYRAVMRPDAPLKIKRDLTR